MADVTETMRRDFTIAAWNGRVAKLEETLAAYPDAIHWKRSDSGETALIYAVASGSLAKDTFAVLLAKGSDVNAKDDSGWTALMYAAANGGKDMARKLLEAGADTTLRNNEENTAVAVAEKKNTIWTHDVAKLILKHEFNIAEQKRLEEKRLAAAMAESETAQAHTGLEQRVVIRGPLTLKR